MSDPTNAFPLKLLGCLIKGPLGCLAFLFGAVVVFVVFFPPACGSIIEQEVGTWFDEQHEGTLSIEKAWVGSVYGQQKIQGITLRDPQDSKVFEAVITAPSLDGLFLRDGSSGSWGPVAIHMPSVDLVQYADGSTNLSRAVRRRGEVTESDLELDFSTGSETVTIGPLTYDSSVLAIDLRLTIDRFSWKAATQQELVLRDVECDGQLLSAGGSLRLQLTGRGVFDGGMPDGLVFDLGIESLERLGEPAAFAPWSLNVELREAPVLLLEAVLGRTGQLRPALGEVVKRCDLLLVAQSPGLCRVEELEVRSVGHANVSAVGSWDAEDDVLTAESSDFVLIGFPVDSWWTHEVVGTLLPLMDEVELASSNGYANLELQEFRIPLSEDLWNLSAHCTVQAGKVRYRLPASVAGELLIEEQGESETPLVIQLDGGVANFASFFVPTASDRLEVRGALDLKERTYELRVTTPDGREYRVEGPREAPRLVAD